MTAEAAAIAARRPGIGARLVGLGSVYGKSLRDGRRASVIAASVLGGMMLAGGAAMAAEWDTLPERVALAAQMEMLPEVLRGLLGRPLALETLGGFLSWRFGNIAPVMLGIWSVVALSSTLASESRRGTLDLVAATPVSRRWIAAEKALAHVTLVAVTMVAGAILTWLATIVFATLPGDEVSLGAALAHYTLTGLLMLAGGAAAFAVAPILGRGRALALGFVVLFGGFLVEAYAAAAPILESLRPVSIFSWTVDHRPLAGQWDWLPLGVLATFVVALLAAGVVAFERRDIGITLGSGPLRLPDLPAGTGGPLRRQLADRFGSALGWGLGIGLYAFVIAISADAFAEAVGGQPQLQRMIEALYPGIELGEPAGVIQLAFFAFGSLMIGLAATVMVGAWGSDESERRLDVVLSAPISRFRWAIGSGLGLLIGISLVSVVIGLLVAVGILTQGGSIDSVPGGVAVLALYGTAFGGIGLAVGGVIGTRFAATAAGGLVIGSFLLELLGNALNLPDWIVDLSLNGHLGQPLLGSFDAVGIGVTLGLTVGGLLLGAWGWRRRDIGR